MPTQCVITMSIMPQKVEVSTNRDNRPPYPLITRGWGTPISPKGASNPNMDPKLAEPEFGVELNIILNVFYMIRVKV